MIVGDHSGTVVKTLEVEEPKRKQEPFLNRRR